MSPAVGAARVPECSPLLIRPGFAACAPVAAEHTQPLHCCAPTLALAPLHLVASARVQMQLGSLGSLLRTLVPQAAADAACTAAHSGRRR